MVEWELLLARDPRWRATMFGTDPAAWLGVWAGRRRGRVKMLEHRRREEGGKGFLGPGCQEWQLARIRVWKEEEVDERWRAS